MNPTLQSARDHYATLPPHIKERPTAKHLIAAIQLCEEQAEENKVLHGAMIELSRKLDAAVAMETMRVG